MADQDPINPNNGSGPQGEPGGEPQIAQIAQYIKDMSVESPNAPAVFQWQVQPQVDIGFNININNITDEVHEVILKVSVNAKSENGAHFLIDLSYAGLFGIRNIPDNAIGAFLLVEAPRLLFPFARQVIAESVQNTGFPPLLIEPIDFGAAYVQQLEATQGEQGAGNGNGEEAPPAGDENQG